MAVDMMSITDILNVWNEQGIFAYVIPFLLIFAVVFAILRKTNILGGKENKYTMEAIVAVAIGLLSLLSDMVSEFFAVIFPRFGVGLSIFLVLLILIGFFYPESSGANKKLSWIGWIIGIGVAIWALSEWDSWYGATGFGGWFSEYIWALIVLGGLVALIVIFSKTAAPAAPAAGGRVT